jgi:hypothetical protein
MLPLGRLSPRRCGGGVGLFSRLTLIFYIIHTSSCSPVPITESEVASLDSREADIVAHWDEIFVDRQSPPEQPDGTSLLDVDADHSEELLARSSSNFPTAFETLGNNFTTTSCPRFFDSFLNDSSFKSCYALSLLLQNSNSFFAELGSAVTLDQVVQTSCSANVTTCSAVMSKLASNLTSNTACAQDYSLGNPVVTQAYEGLISYEPIYRSTCLKDPSTQEFCFTEAATNDTNVTDYYVYFLPLGMSLPGSSRPTCNRCLQATMEVFQQAALSKGQPLTQTYIPAAQQINLGCGPGFVNATVKVGSQASISAAGATITPPSILTFSIYTLFLGMALVLL